LSLKAKEHPSIGSLERRAGDEVIELLSGEAVAEQKKAREAGTQGGEERTLCELFESLNLAALGNDVEEEERQILYAMMASIFA
jgi:hypothetical protein